MQTRTIRLDHVHDVAHISIGSRVYTLFSFSSNQLKIFNAEIRGAPKLRTGMNLTFAMKRTNDWQSLVGFLDHDTGEIFLHGYDQPWLIGFTAVFALLTILGIIFNDHASAMAAIPFLAALLLFTQKLLRGYTDWQARKLLRQKKAELFSGQSPTA